MTLSITRRLKDLRITKPVVLTKAEAEPYGFFIGDNEVVRLDPGEGDRPPSYRFLFPGMLEFDELIPQAEADEIAGIEYLNARLPKFSTVPTPEELKTKGKTSWGNVNLGQETLNSLRKLYPEHFKVVDEQDAIQRIKDEANTNTESFVKDIQLRGESPDTVNILKSLGLDDAGIDEVFKEVQPVSDKTQLLMKALPVLVKPRSAQAMTEYFDKNPDKLRRNLITVGRNTDTEALVRSLYPKITDRGMEDYFSPRVSGIVAGVPSEALGKLPERTWLEKVKELRKKPAQLVPFVSSGVEIVTLSKLLMTAKDLEDGKEVSLEDLQALKAYVEKATLDTSWGYEVADVIAQLVPFAGEFILTGGIFSVGKTATVKAGEQALKKLATRTGLRMLEGKLAKYGVEVAGVIAGGTLRAIPAGVTRIPAATLEKQLTATLIGDEELVWQSALKALGEQWVEVVSESTSGLFALQSRDNWLRLGCSKLF